jgi:molybdopterin/thiamine biosynthesis adenylyltransferase
MTKMIADPHRGLDFYNPLLDKKSHAIIVGAGAIGSYTAFGLARMGVKKLTLIDHDIVEPHNLPNQFFAESLNIGKGVFKVDALFVTIKLIVPDVEIKVFRNKWEEVVRYESLAPASAIVTAVDSMEVRKLIFDSTRYLADYLLDSRTGGLYANVLGIDLHNSEERDYYKASLHPSTEAAPLPCSGQSIVDTSMAVSAELIGRYRTLVMGRFHPALLSFHDYSTGCSWILQTRKKPDDKSAYESNHTQAENEILAVGAER